MHNFVFSTYIERKTRMDQETGPNNHLNRAQTHLNRALKELQDFREQHSAQFVEQPDSMFRTNFLGRATVDAADVVAQLLRHAQGQIMEIKAMNKRKERRTKP